LRTPFDRKIDENFGYVSSVQGAYKLIGEFKTRSTTKFSCFKVDKDFGNIGLTKNMRVARSVHWTVQEPALDKKLVAKDVHAHLDNKLMASHILSLLPNAIKMLHVNVNKTVPCDAACCFGGTHLGQEKNTTTGNETCFSRCKCGFCRCLNRVQEFRVYRVQECCSEIDCMVAYNNEAGKKD
ncbi:unnamed protein product, partial [Porites evermanni]